MGFDNEALREAMSSGRYICSECGGLLEFEDKYKNFLVCPKCGHSLDFDRYGCENDEDYDALYPTLEEVVGYGEEDDDEGEEYERETYDEVCGELDDYVIG